MQSEGQQATSEKSKDGCQKGGRHFFHKNLRHPSFNLPETKITKPLEDNSAQERGETFFPKYNTYALTRLVNKLSIEVQQKKKLRPGDGLLEKGGLFSKKNNPNKRRPERQQLASRRTFLILKAVQLIPKGTRPLQKAAFEKDPLGQHAPKTKYPRAAQSYLT